MWYHWICDDHMWCLLVPPLTASGVAAAHLPSLRHRADAQQNKKSNSNFTSQAVQEQFECHIRGQHWLPQAARATARSSADAQPKKQYSSSQFRQCSGRNSLNVTLDISTDCVSQWDIYRWLTASGGGKVLLLVCIRQGLDWQFSESKLWLPPTFKLTPSICTLVRWQTYAHEN